MNRRWSWVIVLVVGAVWAGYRLTKPYRRAAEVRGGGGGAGGMMIPALAADEDEGLRVPIESAPTKEPAGRRLRMRIGGGGEALLTLYDPGAGNEHGMSFGRGLIEAADPARGAAVVEAVAAWLGEKAPSPPRRKGELRPFRINYVRLGDDGKWQANKLFLEQGSESAELYFNVRADGREARLLEKDEDYRQPLLALLALALRDGQPGRRTPETDPALAAAGPLVQSLAPIAGASRASEPARWVGKRWLATTKASPDRILLWEDLRKPPRTLVEIPGRVSALAASPAGDRLAVTIVHPKGDVGISSADPTDMALVNVADGSMRTIFSSGSGGDGFGVNMLSAVVFAPDGAMLAIGGHGPPGKQSGLLARVYDTASGRLVASSRREVDAAPLRWDATDGLTLVGWQMGGGAKGAPAAAPKRRFWFWSPGKGDPRRAADDERTTSSLVSPDGRYAVTVGPAAIDIRSLAAKGDRERRRFAPAEEGDRTALAALAEDPETAAWFGPHALALSSDADLVLDLGTAKLRYLLPDDGTRLSSASPDGRFVVARSADGDKLLWGEVVAGKRP